MTQSEGPNPAEDRRLWQRCRTMDAEEDETARFLDLASYADGLLDIEERERVAALLIVDPQAAAFSKLLHNGEAWRRPLHWPAGSALRWAATPRLHSGILGSPARPVCFL